jgi:hypothetical protein
LRAVQREFPRINAHLKAHRDPMNEEVVANMMSGYTFVDRAISDDESDLFVMGHLKSLLELNTRVLCGTDETRREQYARHLDATERRFYDQEGGGIRDIMEWYAMHKDESPWRRAAGVYIRILSAPQLYIEGNHRSGALIMSYILAREGNPPFVLTVDNAQTYFNPSTLITQTKKHSMTMLVRLPRLKKRFAEFLANQADPTSLCS